jgi:uncharacterized protein (UPF0335 family)
MTDEAPKSGHNQLKSITERINRLEDEKKEAADAIREIYAEAKSNGYDVPALRAIIRAMREDTEKRRAREANINLYRGTLGID